MSQDQDELTQPQLLRRTADPEALDDKGRRVFENHARLRYGREYAQWFADDGVAKARMTKILRILSSYAALGEEYGVKLSLTKTVVMLPPILDPIALENVIQAYLDVGLVRDKILVHPYSVPQNTWRPEINTVSSIWVYT